MHQLEVFFDYICPFCYRGHGYLTELLPHYPQVEVKWMPCEAHPRPDNYGPHSDLCIMGMFFVIDNGYDLIAYHERMFRAKHQDQIDIEDLDVLTDYVKDLVDADAYRAALQDGRYRDKLLANNRYAFEESGVWVVPSYRMDGRSLNSEENVGVSREQLRDFLEAAGN